MVNLKETFRIEKLKQINWYFIAYRFVFLFAFAVYFLKRYFPQDSVSIYFILSIGLSSLILAWNTFRRGWTWETVFAIFAAVAYVSVLPVHFYTRDSLSTFSVLSFFFLSVAVDKKDKQFLKTVFLTRLLLALSVLGLFDFGFFQDFLMQRGDKVRHSFGFGHPNSLGMYLVVLFIDYFLMIGQKNVSKLTYLVCLGISLLVFAATDSRLGFLASLLVLLVGAFKERLTKYQIKGILLWLGIVLLYLLGIFLSYSYKENSDFYQNLNTLFSNRLLNAYNYIQAYGFHLWPNDYPPLYYGQTMVYNENFYIDTLLKNGLLLYLLYPILMFMQLKNKVVNLYPACLMLLCFLFAMVEDYEASVLMATPLLFNYFAEEKDELHSQSELEI